jgi:hypothetical protein
MDINRETRMLEMINPPGTLFLEDFRNTYSAIAGGIWPHQHPPFNAKCGDCHAALAITGGTPYHGCIQRV